MTYKRDNLLHQKSHYIDKHRHIFGKILYNNRHHISIHHVRNFYLLFLAIMQLVIKNTHIVLKTALKLLELQPYKKQRYTTMLGLNDFETHHFFKN